MRKLILASNVKNSNNGNCIQIRKIYTKLLTPFDGRFPDTRFGQISDRFLFYYIRLFHEKSDPLRLVTLGLVLTFFF